MFYFIYDQSQIGLLLCSKKLLIQNIKTGDERDDDNE